MVGCNNAISITAIILNTGIQSTPEAQVTNVKVKLSLCLIKHDVMKT
jgi:hypothetical protein